MTYDFLAVAKVVGRHRDGTHKLIPVLVAIDSIQQIGETSQGVVIVFKEEHIREIVIADTLTDVLNALDGRTDADN